MRMRRSSWIVPSPLSGTPGATTVAPTLGPCLRARRSPRAWASAAWPPRRWPCRGQDGATCSRTCKAQGRPLDGASPTTSSFGPRASPTASRTIPWSRRWPWCRTRTTSPRASRTRWSLTSCSERGSEVAAATAVVQRPLGRRAATTRSARRLPPPGTSATRAVQAIRTSACARASTSRRGTAAMATSAHSATCRTQSVQCASTSCTETR
mmetsp:Transcript_72008/g.206678  ORF Transcript_72008/g.206678 Transcript_72008/m.206678 type:complete len:210 (-) Transcript_72008:769-1398(-)